MRFFGVFALVLAALLPAQAFSNPKPWIHFGHYSAGESCSELLSHALTLLPTPRTLLTHLLDEERETQKLFFAYGGPGPYRTAVVRELVDLARYNDGKLLFWFNSFSEFERGAPELGKLAPSFYFGIRPVQLPVAGGEVASDYSNLSPAFQRVLTRVDQITANSSAQLYYSNLQVIEVRRGGATMVSWIPLATLEGVAYQP